MTDTSQHKAEIFKERMQKMRDAAQQLIIDSLRSNLSDYALRTKQAEELTGILLNEKLTPDEMNALIHATVMQHITDKANERAVHQQQVLQTTSLAVNNLRNMLKDELSEDIVSAIRGTVNIIVQGLATALGNMSNFEKPPAASKPDQPNQ